MVRFIKQEAEEKANEIRVSAEEVWCPVSRCGECQRSCTSARSAPKLRTVPAPPPCDRRALQEFNLEKLQLLEQEKAKIRKEYERREGQVEVKKKMCVQARVRSRKQPCTAHG
jgi:hypothetical protein